MIAKHAFRETLWLMVIPHHATFESLTTKRSIGQKILSGKRKKKKFNKVLNLRCDLDLEYSKVIFSQYSSL